MAGDPLKAYLHQASSSALQELCDDAGDTVLNENDGVTPEWSCNPHLEGLQCFQWEQYHQSCRSVDADACCKRALNVFC